MLFSLITHSFSENSLEVIYSFRIYACSRIARTVYTTKEHKQHFLPTKSLNCLYIYNLQETETLFLTTVSRQFRRHIKTQARTLTLQFFKELTSCLLTACAPSGNPSALFAFTCTRLPNS